MGLTAINFSTKTHIIASRGILFYYQFLKESLFLVLSSAQCSFILESKYTEQSSLMFKYLSFFIIPPSNIIPSKNHQLLVM